MTPIYLRDLQPELRAEIERDIAKKPEAYAEGIPQALEDGEDITVGYFLTVGEYKTSN